MDYLRVIVLSDLTVACSITILNYNTAQPFKRNVYMFGYDWFSIAQIYSNQDK